MALQSGSSRELLRLTLGIAVEDLAAGASLVRSRIARWLHSLRGVDLPEAAFSHRGFEWRRNGFDCEALRFDGEGEDLWALRARSGPTASLAGFEVLEFTVDACRAEGAEWSLRVLERDGRTALRVPGIVAEIASAVPLTRLGERVEAAPLLVDSDEDVDVFCRWLCLPDRSIPVIVLSVPDDAENPRRPLLDAESLARDVAGLGRVAVLPARYTWKLTERFGKKLGVYRGAVRIYQPGFDGQVAGESHWAVMADRLRAPASRKRHREDIIRRAGKSALTGPAVTSYEELRARARERGVPPFEALDAARIVGGRGANVPAAPDVPAASAVPAAPAAGALLETAGNSGAGSAPVSAPRPAGTREPAAEGHASGVDATVLPGERRSSPSKGRRRSLLGWLLAGFGRDGSGPRKDREALGGETSSGEARRLAEKVGQLRVERDVARAEVERLRESERARADEGAERDEAFELAAEQERTREPLLTEIQRLRDRLRGAGVDPDRGLALPAEWSGFAGWCEREFAGRLVLHPRALRELKKARFADVALAARALQWLAGDYRDARRDGKGESLKIPIAGLRNERCGGDGFDLAWPGGKLRADWHVKSGGNTRDPERCLRVYYAWDGAGDQVVVAFMPGHVRSRLT